MGLLSALGITKKTENVQAQYAPAIMDTAYGYGSFTTGVGNFPGGLDRNGNLDPSQYPGLSIVCCFTVLLIGELQNYMQMI
jgi:hypothetical protein